MQRPSEGGSYIVTKTGLELIERTAPATPGETTDALPDPAPGDPGQD